MGKKKDDGGTARVMIPVRIEPELKDRIDRILYWSPRGRSMQSIAEAAIRAAVEKIEKAEGPFEPLPSE
jgi:predicted transcriptional regulator